MNEEIKQEKVWRPIGSISCPECDSKNISIRYYKDGSWGWIGVCCHDCKYSD